MNSLLTLLISFQFSGASLPPDSTSWEATADTVIELAMDQLGVTYQWGGCSPGKCFDCSGLLYYAYKEVGVHVARSSHGLATLGRDIPLEEARKGDAIIFTGTQPGDTSAGHCGIVLSNEDGLLKFIHCSSSEAHFGVVITEYQNSGYPKRFHSIKRVIE